MGNDWEEPRWRQHGRLEDGELAPRYASRRDRNRVRSGKDDQIGKPGFIAKLFRKGKHSK